MREVSLGPSLGGSYVITQGLKEGEEIVTNGAFSIDASAQLAGKPSMMNMEVVPDDIEIKTYELKVFGNCSMCKERIEKAVKSLYGIKSASWDSKTKMLTIDYYPDNTVIEKVHKEVAKVGHDTEKEKASDDVYNDLHECCKYRPE